MLQIGIFCHQRQLRYDFKEKDILNFICASFYCMGFINDNKYNTFKSTALILREEENTLTFVSRTSKKFYRIVQQPNTLKRQI